MLHICFPCTVHIQCVDGQLFFNGYWQGFCVTDYGSWLQNNYPIGAFGENTGGELPARARYCEFFQGFDNVKWPHLDFKFQAF